MKEPHVVRPSFDVELEPARLLMPSWLRWPNPVAQCSPATEPTSKPLPHSPTTYGSKSCRKFADGTKRDLRPITSQALLGPDFQSFLTARQLLIDFIVENQLNDQQYGDWLSDGRVSNETVGVSDELDVAWVRFQRVLFEDCPAIELG